MLGIFGIVDESFGYGRGTVALIKAAALAKIPYRVYQIGQRKPVEHSPELKNLLARQNSREPAVILAHATPPQIRLIPQRYRVWLYSMFERSALPTHQNQGFGGDWVAQINGRAERVFTPTPFPAEVFRSSGVTVPVEVLPYGMQFEGINYRPRQKRALFTVALHGELIPRKGVDLAIEAFQKAFPDQEDARLLVKTYGGAKQNWTDDWRVRVIDGDWPREWLFDWLEQADAYLWLSRGEGLSLPPMEAAVSGLPLVVANHTGMTDWITDDAWNVPAREVPAPDVGNWYEADTNVAAQHLRDIYENRELANDRAARFAGHLKLRYTMHASAVALNAALENYL